MKVIPTIEMHSRESAKILKTVIRFINSESALKFYALYNLIFLDFKTYGNIQRNVMLKFLISNLTISHFS